MKGNPFLKAMEICDGTISIVDSSCEVYNRLWCLYEAYKSMIDIGKERNYKFDVYTHYEDVNGIYKSVGITDGYILRDLQKSTRKKKREEEFPLDRILKAINLDVSTAVATETKDKNFILNEITGNFNDDEPEKYHTEYENLNNILRGKFVVPFLERIIKEEKDITRLFGCLVVFQNSNADIVDLDLRDCKRFTDSLAIYVFNHLPSTIHSLSIQTKNSSITSKGISTILKYPSKLPMLTELILDCNNISNKHVNDIITIIEQNKLLTKLSINHNQLKYNGVKDIINAVKKNRYLKRVDVRSNDIGYEGMLYLAIAEKQWQKVNPEIDFDYWY